MPTDAQAGWHGCTAHAQGFFHSKGKQTIVTSLDDVTAMVFTLRVGSYIRKAHMSVGLLPGFLAAVHLVAIG